MAYTITSLEENGLLKIRLQDSETGVSADILPEFGALLDGLSITLGGTSINVIDNYGSRENLLADLASSYKSSKLSPFACRIRNGQYTFEGKDYEFQTKFPDGSAIHGLLYNKPFTVANTAAIDRHAVVELHYRYDQEDKGFPYSYTCEVVYTLSRNTLKLETTVTNQSEKRMPLTDGWHPYFRLNGKVNDWKLQFNGNGMVEFDNALIPTGKMLEYTSFQQPEALGELELDNCFLLDFSKNGPAAVLSNPANGLNVRFYPDENYPYLQMYIPPHRTSIAIENLSGVPNCFNNGIGLVTLEPGEIKKFTTAYEVAAQ